MSRGEEKVSALAKTIKAILETGNSERDVIDKFAAALHQLGLTKEAELVFAAASVLWDQPSDVDQIAAWFEAEAVKERKLLDSGFCNNPVTTQERWLVYKASAQRHPRSRVEEVPVQPYKEIFETILAKLDAETRLRKRRSLDTWIRKERECVRREVNRLRALTRAASDLDRRRRARRAPRRRAQRLRSQVRPRGSRSRSREGAPSMTDRLASALFTIASWSCLPDRIREDVAIAAAFLILRCAGTPARE